VLAFETVYARLNVRLIVLETIHVYRIIHLFAHCFVGILSSTRFAFNMLKHFFFAALKLRVMELLLVLFCSTLSEVVHVKLSHKRREVIMFKMLWKYLVGKIGRLLDDERITIIRPTDDLICVWVLRS